VKYIEKSREPKALRDWKKKNRGGPNEHSYDALDCKDAIRTMLRKEQGGLCAYTMAAIDERVGSHVEHVQPRKHFPNRATDYRNMVLCVPENGPCEWGAVAKGNTRVDESNFVSPLNANCEVRLRYRLSGEVAPVMKSDEAAKNTIEILNLNHRVLVRARQDALRAQGILARSNGLSATQARRLSRSVLTRDSLGLFPPYCIAISQAANLLAYRAESRAHRLTAKPAD
jgi:uncharacterized protein (TIGR02646 family)